MITLNKERSSVSLVTYDSWKTIIPIAWKVSRPLASEKELKDVDKLIKLDIPISELAGLVLNFRTSVLFREIILSLRNHIAWARSSRVDDLSKQWNIFKYIDDKGVKEIEALAQNLIKAKLEGERQDNFRKSLPLGYMTSYVARFSIRDLVKLYKYITSFVPTDENAELTTFQSECAYVSINLKKIFKEIQLPEDITKSIKSFDIIDVNYKHQSTEQSANRVGNYIHVNVCNIPMCLRAQIVRHRHLQFKDDVAKYFTNVGYACTIKDTVNMELMGSIETWSHILRSRFCWLAQTDLWKPIIDLVSPLLTAKEIKRPCSIGVCPYNADGVKRLEKQDPGIPCPCNILLNKDEDQAKLVSTYLKENPDYYFQAKEYKEISGRPAYWDKLIEQVKTKF